ncbi:MAG: hypothetical protein QGM50_09645 [Anaerolineae bacterium]|nr:hypothetical protein [Anaerolineae bacterium]
MNCPNCQSALNFDPPGQPGRRFARADLRAVPEAPALVARRAIAES